MPLSLPRMNSHPSNTTEPTAGRGNVDVNRALPPLPRIAVHHDVPSPNRKPEHEANGSTRQTHTRSFSHPFPSFFGGGSKKSEKRNLKNKLSVEFTGHDEENGNGRPSQPSGTPSRNSSVKNGSEPMTGKCMTCDSTVRWPRDLKVFRCTVCLTVNDLEPNHVAGENSSAKHQNQANPLFTVPRKRTCRSACLVEVDIDPDSEQLFL
jgi:E3 ubiquitin-protein ligase HECTD2